EENRKESRRTSKCWSDEEKQEPLQIRKQFPFGSRHAPRYEQMNSILGLRQLWLGCNKNQQGKRTFIPGWKQTSESGKRRGRFSRVRPDSSAERWQPERASVGQPTPATWASLRSLANPNSFSSRP